MRHGNIHELRHKLPWRRLAHEQPDLFKGVGGPRKENEQGDKDGTNGIQVPDETVAGDGHDETKDVDDNVVAMVNLEALVRETADFEISRSTMETYEEDVDRGISPEEETVDHQRSLIKDYRPSEHDLGGGQSPECALTRDADENDGNDLERLRPMISRSKRPS